MPRIENSARASQLLLKLKGGKKPSHCKIFVSCTKLHVLLSKNLRKYQERKKRVNKKLKKIKSKFINYLHTRFIYLHFHTSYND